MITAAITIVMRIRLACMGSHFSSVEKPQMATQCSLSLHSAQDKGVANAATQVSGLELGGHFTLSIVGV